MGMQSWKMKFDSNSVLFGLILAVCLSPFAIALAGLIASTEIWRLIMWDSKYFAFKTAFGLIELLIYTLGAFFFQLVKNAKAKKCSDAEK